MNPEEAKAAVGGHVVARYAYGEGEHARGRVLSYSIVPVLVIETADGEVLSWRHDLCDPIPQPGGDARP